MRKLHQTINNNWPEVIPLQQKLACYKGFQEATSMTALTETACAVCGQLTKKAQIIELDASDFPSPHLLRPDIQTDQTANTNYQKIIEDGHLTYDIPELDGLLLNKMGILDRIVQ